MSAEGFLLIDKPADMPSFALISRVRKVMGIKKVGFAGTLDPFATGLMVLALGRTYTRQLDRIHAWPKTYEVKMVFGKSTPTLDPEGEIVFDQPVSLTSEQIFSAVTHFQGTYDQLPPQFSAKKIQGKPAYAYARKGKEVTLAPVPVTVYEIQCFEQESGPYPTVRFSVTCSKGTYIRSLVRDIAEKLGTKGMAMTLRRTAIGPLSCDEALGWPFDADQVGTHLRPLPLEETR